MTSSSGRGLVLLGAVILALWWHCVVPAIARADGSLPPLPYRYLHPPAALKGDNKPPTAGQRVLPADYMRAVIHWSVFTPDGQAGVSGSKGSIWFSRSADGVLIRIDPVELPPGLPATVAANGNAYRVRIVDRPHNRPVTVVHPISLSLSWPHLPIAIYTWNGTGWSQLCYSDKAFVTGSTITCSTRNLGVFVVVTTPSGGTPPNFPTTPVTGGRFAWINKYIPLIAPLAIIIGAGLAAFAVSRPRKPEKGKK